MNETNSLETRLRSWAPRPPASTLKHRIFGAPAANPFAGYHWNWLTPAAACIFVALAVLNQHEGMLSGRLREQPVMLLSSSNIEAASSLSRNSARLTNTTFELTNFTRPLSATGTFLPFSTGRNSE